MKYDQFEYVISSHYLSALINADYSGLSDNESLALDQFTTDAIENANGAGFVVMHWDVVADSNNFKVCEVCGLYADVVTILLIVRK